MIVTQARQLWLASALLRSRDDTGLRAAADHGYRFLHGRHVGHSSTAASTGRSTHRHARSCAAQKHLYGQAFAIYALAEYAMATGDKAGARRSRSTAFRLIDAKAHDARTAATANTSPPTGAPAPAGDTPPLGAPADLQADEHPPAPARGVWRRCCRASADPLVRERLIELVTIETHTVVRMAGTAQHRSVPGATGRRILDAPDGARVVRTRYREHLAARGRATTRSACRLRRMNDLFRTLFANALAHGYDDARRRVLRQRPAGPGCRSPQQDLVGAGRGARQRAHDVPADRRRAVRRRVPADVAVRQRHADRLGVRRVVRSGGARWLDGRRQGASVEGGLPQWPRASRTVLATASPKPVARSRSQKPVSAHLPTTHCAIWSNGPRRGRRR